MGLGTGQRGGVGLGVKHWGGGDPADGLKNSDRWTTCTDADQGASEAEGVLTDKRDRLRPVSASLEARVSEETVGHPAPYPWVPNKSDKRVQG